MAHDVRISYNVVLVLVGENLEYASDFWYHVGNKNIADQTSKAN